MNAMKNTILSLMLIFVIIMPAYSNDVQEGKKLTFDRKKGNCLACHMIDDGELDWKVIAINSADEMATQLNDIADVEAKMPGVVSGIREWFRWYKTPDNKPLNAFGFDEKCLDKAAAVAVIEETHDHWKALKEGRSEAGKLWLN